MSKTIAQKGFIVWKKYEWETKASFVFLDYKPSDTHESVVVMPYTLRFEMPDEFDPVPAQVRGLEAQKAKALQEYQKTVEAINEQLSKLQAITYEPEAA